MKKRSTKQFLLGQAIWVIGYVFLILVIRYQFGPLTIGQAWGIAGSIVLFDILSDIRRIIQNYEPRKKEPSVEEIVKNFRDPVFSDEANEILREMTKIGVEFIEKKHGKDTELTFQQHQQLIEEARQLPKFKELEEKMTATLEKQAVGIVKENINNLDEVYGVKVNTPKNPTTETLEQLNALFMPIQMACADLGCLGTGDLTEDQKRRLNQMASVKQAIKQFHKSTTELKSV